MASSKRGKGKERVVDDYDEEEGKVRTKRRKVTISRVYEGLDRHLLVPEDTNQTLDDTVEDVEVYRVEELYPTKAKREKTGEEEISYVIHQPGVSSTRSHGDPYANTSSSEDGVGEELSFGQNILSYNDGDISILVPKRSGEGLVGKVGKTVLDEYITELDESAAPRLAEANRRRLARDDPHGDHYGDRDACYEDMPAEEREMMEASDIRMVRNAFGQVPGRPNCYSFGAYEGKGFSGCGVVDPFSLPIMYERHDFHMWTWENDVYDYMNYAQFREYEHQGVGIPSLRDIKRIARESLKMESRNILREARMVSKTREDAANKLSYLYQQLVEFTHERAFREKGLTDQNVLVYRGDPCARVVFLLKSPNGFDMKDSGTPYTPKLARDSKDNGLGKIQDQLYYAARQTVMDYFNRTSRKTTIGELDAAIHHMLPILTGECDVDGYDSGVAFLYCVPIHDPDKWGKKRHEQESKERSLGGYQPYGAQKEFPTNVLTFMDYARIALRIISPIIIISTSRFTTQCLSAGMDPKKIPGMTNAVDKHKWFTIRLSTQGVGSGAGASTTSASASKAAVKMIYDSETKKMVKQRLDAWCIRGDHPFVVRSNELKMLPAVKTLTQRVASKLFSEYDMRAHLSGRSSTLDVFSLGGPSRTKELTGEDASGTNPAFPARQLMSNGNYVCKGVTAKHIERFRTDNRVSVVIGVCEEANEAEQMAPLDEATGYGSGETPCLKVEAGGTVSSFPSSIANTSFWKVDLPCIIHQACLYPGVDLVKNLRERKTKTSVATLVIRTKAIKTTDPRFFDYVPRYPGVTSEEERKSLRLCIDQRLKEYRDTVNKREEKRCTRKMGVGRFIASKRKEAASRSTAMTGRDDDPFEKVHFMLDGFEENGERATCEGMRGFGAWYNFLFVPRLMVDVTRGLNELGAQGSVDYAVFYASVLEMIERTVFSEAHRMVHEEALEKNLKNPKPPKTASKRQIKGPPPYVNMGKTVNLMGQKFFDHSECTLNSKVSDDVKLEWIEMLSDVGMQVKRALKKYVDALL